MRTLTLHLCAVALGVAALFLGGVTYAQQDPAPSPSTAILVLNQERLLQQTAYGRRLAAELEAASATLSAENRRIETQLTEEELELTRLRPTMEADAFREMADEFDQRVTAIRGAQDAKTRDLQAQADTAQQQFFEQSVPILLQLIDERDAAVLLDSRSVLLSAGSVDITEAAIAAVDAALGNGGDDPIISLPGVVE